MVGGMLCKSDKPSIIIIMFVPWLELIQLIILIVLFCSEILAVRNEEG